jgi:plasmid segregation protein ParM
MTELVFGIDHGNGNMKSQSVCIPCGLVRYSSEPGRFMNEDILEYQGSYYTLSDTRMPYKSDKTADKEYFILTLFILAMEAKNRNVSLDGCEVLLGIGVPPADFSQQAGKFKQYFLDEAMNGVTFKWNGSEIHFAIKDVQVSPQNFAAVFCYKASLFKQYRTVNCIDIGDGTVDLLVIRKGQPDLSVRVSERLGIAVLRSEIANAIQQNYGLQLESSDVEQVLMKEPTVLDAEVIAEIHRLADEWMIRIVNKLHTYVPDFRINPTVFLGGGSFVLHDQIKASPDFKYIEFIDNINANAVGYAMLVKAKLKRQ